MNTLTHPSHSQKQCRAPSQSSTLGSLDLASAPSSPPPLPMSSAVNGSEFRWSHRSCTTSTTARRWAAQLVQAVDSLHGAGVLCRDLRPHNLLLDADGGLLLTYQCAATHVQPHLSRYALEHYYCAPG